MPNSPPTRPPATKSNRNASDTGIIKKNPRSPLIKRMGRVAGQGESWVVYRAILTVACFECLFPKHNQLFPVLESCERTERATDAILSPD